MKKLLAIIGTVGLTTPAIGTIVSCTNPFAEKKPDYWTGKQWQDYLNDLTFENLSHESEMKEKYRLVSKKLGLDFIVEKKQFNNKTYGVIDKLLRLEEFNFDKFNKLSTIDTCIVVATSEKNLPSYSEHFVKEFDTKSTWGEPIIERITVKNVKAGQVGEVDERPFVFEIYQREMYLYFGFLFFEMYRKLDFINKKITLGKNEKIEDVEEIIWNEFIFESINRLSQSDEVTEKTKKHFKENMKVVLDIDNDFEPYWEWDPIYQDYQQMNNSLVYNFNKMKFKFNFRVRVRTNQPIPGDR